MSAATDPRISYQAHQLARVRALQAAVTEMGSTLQAMADAMLAAAPAVEPLDTRSPIQDRVIAVVCRATGVSRAEIVGRRRSEHIAFARHVVVFLLREFTPMTRSQVGMLLGGRDHGTMFNSERAVRDAMQTSPDARRLVEACRRELEGGR